MIELFLALTLYTEEPQDLGPTRYYHAVSCQDALDLQDQNINLACTQQAKLADKRCLRDGYVHPDVGDDDLDCASN